MSRIQKLSASVHCRGVLLGAAAVQSPLIAAPRLLKIVKVWELNIGKLKVVGMKSNWNIVKVKTIWEAVAVWNVLWNAAWFGLCESENFSKVKNESCWSEICESESCEGSDCNCENGER